MKEFLLKTKVKDYGQSSKGVTFQWTLTLSDGKLTHKASFQSIDEFHPAMALDNGEGEILY